MTVAEALQHSLDKKGWTQQELADAMKTSRQTVSALLNDRSGLTPDMALRLEKLFEIKAEKWLELQARQELAALRKLALYRKR